MANVPKNLAAFLSFFFLLRGFSLAIGGQRGPVSGLEQRLGSGGKRTSPHLLGNRGRPRDVGFMSREPGWHWPQLGCQQPGLPSLGS